MTETATLETKLNRIIDTETEKGYKSADSELVIECSEALLRMDNEIRYQLSDEEYTDSLKHISDSSSKLMAVSGKKIKVLVFAAILLLLSVFAVTAYELNKYDIVSFSDHFSIITEKKHRLLKEELIANYIPDNFIEVNHDKLSYTETIEYNNGNKILLISKTSSYDNIIADNEHGTPHRIEINGIVYTVYGGEDAPNSVLWIFDDCLYSIYGNLEEDEIIKVAVSVR